MILRNTLCCFLCGVLAIKHHLFHKIIKWGANARNFSFRNSYTLSTQLVKPNYFIISHQSFFRNLPRWLIFFIENMHRESSHRKSWEKQCLVYLIPVTFKSCHVATEVNWKMTKRVYHTTTSQTQVRGLDQK